MQRGHCRSVRHTTALPPVRQFGRLSETAQPGLRASWAHVGPSACFSMHRQRVIHRTTLTLQKHEPTTRDSAGGDATRPGPVRLEEPAAVLEAVVLGVVVGRAEEDAPELCVSASAPSAASAEIAQGAIGSAGRAQRSEEQGGQAESRENRDIRIASSCATCCRGVRRRTRWRFLYGLAEQRALGDGGWGSVGEDAGDERG